MNKITRKKPNYIKLFMLGNMFKFKIYYFDTDNVRKILNGSTYGLLLGGRSNGKQYVLNELNKKYGKGGDR